MSNGSPFTAAQLGTNTYGNVWLSLATIAYYGDKSAAQAVPAIQTAIGELDDFPGTTGGTWNLDWGPVLMAESGAAKNVNLMYVVSYAIGGQPQFIAVVIRGTDVSSIWQMGQICSQLAEDLDVSTLYDWSQIVSNPTGTVPTTQYQTSSSSTGPDTPPAIAQGTWLGLTCLRQMQQATLNSPFVSSSSTPPQPNPPFPKDGAAPWTVEQYVRAFTAAYPGVPVVVTGHSLGGCQTTALGLILAMQNPGVVVAHPFAPPSAGNANWNTAYQQAFTDVSGAPLGQFWWNVFDVAPNAFQTSLNLPQPVEPFLHALMGNIPNMWGGVYGNGPTIDTIDDGIWSTYNTNAGNGYTSLANSLPPSYVQRMIPPQVQSGGPDWLGQLTTQHFPPQYFSLLSAITPPIEPFTRPPNPDPSSKKITGP